jgi:hypothetical protein
MAQSDETKPLSRSHNPEVEWFQKYMQLNGAYELLQIQLKTLSQENYALKEESQALKTELVFQQESARGYLSAFEKYKPIIAIVIHICHAIEGLWYKTWRILGGIAILLAIYFGGVQFHLWPGWQLSSKAPPVLTTNQTSHHSPGGYTGSRTH